MILKATIKWTAEKHIREILKDFKSVQDMILLGKPFQHWVQSCWETANRLEAEGKIKTDDEIRHFIQGAVCYFADRRIHLANEKNEPL